MRGLYLLLFLCATLNVGAQSVVVEWERSYGGVGYEDSYDIVQTPDSNIIIVGRAGPLAEDFSDCGLNGGYLILKIDTSSEILWSKCYGGNNASIAKTVINTLDGGFILTGNTYAVDGDVTGAHGNADCWVIKIDDLGVLEWQLAIGGSEFDSGADVIQTSDGNFIVVGESSSNDGDISDHNGLTSEEDLIVAKVSSLGELLWIKSYGGTEDDSGNSVIEDDLGNLIIAGNSRSSNGDVPENKGSTDVWVLKIDSLGEIIWSKTFGGSQTDHGNEVAFFNENIYIVGETYSNDFDISGNHGSRDALLLKVDSNGNLMLQKCFGGTKFEEFFDIEVVGSNELMLSGISGSIDGDVTDHYGPSYYSDFWSLTADTLGNIVWQKAIGGSLNDYAYAGIKCFDNSYIVTGYSNSSDGYVTENMGSADIWTVKLNVCNNRYFADIDGDGFGDINFDTIACNAPADYVSDSTDCNDLNPDIHPTLTDICNSLDDNCNGLTDEDVIFITYYLDNDGDLFGAEFTDSISCSVVIGYVENNADCSDLNPEINPLMSEICNAIDDNCNIEIDEGLIIYTLYADTDGDTFGNLDAAIDTCLEVVTGYVNNNLDCNDTLATIYPGATELCNYLDDDCDGIADDNLTYLHSFQDADNDNFGNQFMDSLSCELPTGYVADSTDCDDTNPDIYPGAVEILNGLDDDCDQTADEGLPINELQVQQISLYPNPAFTTIQINSDFSEVGTYSIYASTGQKVMTGIWHSGTQVISIAKLTQGMYLIQLDADGVNYKGTFVKL